MNNNNEFQDWLAKQETTTQTVEETRAELNESMSKLRTITNLTVIVTFLYAITIINRAVKKIIKRRKNR